jgi:hypothetical protein
MQLKNLAFSDRIIPFATVVFRGKLTLLRNLNDFLFTQWTGNKEVQVVR